MRIATNCSYEASWLMLQGHECGVSPNPDGGDVNYTFHNSKALREARRQFVADIDLQEFLEAHRRLTWTTKTATRRK